MSRTLAAALGVAVSVGMVAVPSATPAAEIAALVLTAPSTQQLGSDDPSDVLLADPNGRLILDLTSATGGVSGRTSDREPAWSPDGSAVAFVRDQERRLYISDTAADVRTLAAGGVRNPAWSPDGGRVAFLRGSDVWVVESDGSALRRVATGALNPERWAPAWSPDGSTLLYGCEGSVAGIAGALCVADADAARPPRKVWTSDRVLGASWSPDGRRIAVMGYSGLYRIDVASGASQRLSSLTSRFGIGAPAWSPDGRRIAFVGYLVGSQLVGRNLAHYTDVYAVDSDGGDVRRLTGVRARPTASVDGQALSDGSPEPESMYPVWSPDGSRLVLERRRSLGATPLPMLYVMNADGSCEAPFRNVGVDPSWRPGAPPPPQPRSCVDLALAPQGAGEAALGNLQYPHVVVHEIVPYELKIRNDGNLDGGGLRLELIPSETVRIVRAPNACSRHGAAVSCRLPYVLRPQAELMTGFGIEAKGPDARRGYVTIRVAGDAADVDEGNNTVVMAIWIRPREVAGTLPLAPLIGVFGDETLFGRPGRDVINPAAGADRVFAGGGPDRILANDGDRDVIHCGPGMDVVFADYHDWVARDCERVRRNP